MGILLVILGLLVILIAPILLIISLVKRKTTFPGRAIHPLAVRRRDGAVTYDEYRGVRSNIELEDPRGSHSPRYQRRHASRQHKQTKPWMK